MSVHLVYTCEDSKCGTTSRSHLGWYNVSSDGYSVVIHPLFVAANTMTVVGKIYCGQNCAMKAASAHLDNLKQL